MKLRLFFGALAAATMLFFGAHASLSAAPSDSAEVGSAAPAFSLPDEEGETHTLAQYKGRAVVLEWTNQDCPYVERHYRQDTMEKLAKELGTKDVVWLAVNSTHSNTAEDTKAWRDAQGFEYRTLLDADGKVGKRFGARTTPHMFVIDGEGVLRYAGAIDDDPRGKQETPQNYVRAGVGAVLEGKTPDPSETRPYGCSVKYE